MTSTISPDSGAITSETALTDSTSAYGSSFVIVAPTCGRIEEHDLAERVLRVPGDAEGGGVAVDPGPVVLGVVLEVVGVVGHFGLLRVERLGADFGGAGLATDVDLERRCRARRGPRARRPCRCRGRGSATSCRCVTTPPPVIGLPWRAMPAPVIVEGDELLGGALRARGGDRLRAHEARGLLAGPAEARLDRVARLVHVVAVEVVVDLQAQCVARAEADGVHAGLDQRVPHRDRVVGVEQQLDAVLAGVARAGDEQRRRRRPRAAAVEARRAGGRR